MPIVTNGKVTIDETNMANWQNLYTGMGVSDKAFRAAVKPLEGKGLEKDGHMLIIDLAVVSTERIFEELGKVTKTLKFHLIDLEKITDHNFPVGKDHFAFVESGKEPSEKYANKSFNDVDVLGDVVCSLRQRLLMELYARVTGNVAKEEHAFDNNNWTLTGSVGAYGGAVSVFWDSDARGVGVYWYDPSFAYDYLRSRSAFPLSLNLLPYENKSNALRVLRYGKQANF